METANSSDNQPFQGQIGVLWAKLLEIKNKYKEYELQIKAQNEKLTVQELELSLQKSESARLKEELNLNQNTSSKYQSILKDFLELEGKYCKLIVEKSTLEEELENEKKSRSAVQIRHEAEIKELKDTLQDEIRIVKNHFVSKEKLTETQYNAIIKRQEQEIESLKDTISRKSIELAELNAHLKTQSPDTIRFNKLVSSTTEPVVSHSEPLEERNLHGSHSMGSEDMSLSKLLELNEQLEFNNLHVSSPSKNKIASSDVTEQPRLPLHGKNTYLNPTKFKMKKTQGPVSASADSTKSTSGHSQPLQVFRVPAKRPSKRKLYSRQDDTM